MRFKKNKTQTLNNNHKPQAVKTLKNTKHKKQNTKTKTLILKRKKQKVKHKN